MDEKTGEQPPSGHRRRSLLWRVLRTILLVYVGIVVLLVLFERSLIFFPVKFPEGYWEDKPVGVEDVFFDAADGTRLHGWYAEHDDPSAVILFCHGNAGNITHRTPVLERLHRQLHCTVLMFDYRGYGKSEGSPHETGVLQDGQAAADFLAQKASVEPDDLVLMGRSLGTAVAVDLAARRGARGLVLYSAFSTMPAVAADHYPWIPVRWLMRTRFDSISKIADYHGPLLQAHSEQDRIVPAVYGRRLFEAAPSEQKEWVTLPAGTHNDPFPDSFYQTLHEFLRELP